MHVSLHDFLTCLQFGTLKIGSTPQEVETWLGPPEFFDETENSKLWAYGTTEFFFGRITGFNDFLCQMIFLEASGPQEDGPLIFPAKVTADWPLSTASSIDECRAYLMNENIAFEVVWHDPMSFGIALGLGRVRLTFGEELKLHSFSLSEVA